MKTHDAKKGNNNSIKNKNLLQPSQSVSDNRSEVALLKKIIQETQQSPRIITQRQQFSEALGTHQPSVPNQTGMPDKLKNGMEQLSGFDLSDVRVHYNSPQPQQLQAHAYAQGTSIHLAPGQEKHLPHEAWHVVQQMQGRVKPTMQINGTAVNDSGMLEQEADKMGAEALYTVMPSGRSRQAKPAPGVVQGVFDKVTITRDIRDHAQSIYSAGGTTKEAYRISTTGENNNIIVKFINKNFSVEAAALGKELGIHTPRAVQLDIDDILDKVRELDPDIARIVEGKRFAIAFEYVDKSSTVTWRTKEKFDEGSYLQAGEIAAFDMLIGKTDLFENFDSSEGSDQENYKNLLVVGAKLIDIDLDAAKTGNQNVWYSVKRLDIIDAIIERPLNIHKFTQDKVAGFFEMSDGYDNLTKLKYQAKLLYIQKGILELVARTTGKETDITSNEGAQEMIIAFAKRANAAGKAITEIDMAIDAINRKVEKIQEQEINENKEQPTTTTNKSKQKTPVENNTTSCPCYITTACCDYYGLDDDCYFLRTLRNYRDYWLAKQHGGTEMISEYYAKAPAIVEGINRSPEKALIYQRIYKAIKSSVQFIEKRQPEAALHLYKEMVFSLVHYSAGTPSSED